jgi:hypothetical protein
MLVSAVDELSLIESSKVRKAWYQGEWYFSLIDTIAEWFETDHKRAKSYWSTLKQRLKSNREIVLQIEKIKALTSDRKMYFTDFANQSDLQILRKYLESNIRNHRNRIHRRQSDEVVCFHPKVIAKLEKLGWDVEHHVRLASGGIIDIVAKFSNKTYVIECKPELTNGKLFTAIGQVLCYRLEHNPHAIPVIASYASEINDYVRHSCASLGIELLEIADELALEQ